MTWGLDLLGGIRERVFRLAEVETFYVSSNPRLNAEIERLR